MTYGHYAPKYWSAGWRGILPLPPRAKWPPPDDWTGKGAADPSYADITAWTEEQPKGNIALRLPRGVVGLDWDAYDGKAGATIREELTAKWGPLPATISSTSRGPGQPSRIEFYRVPRATELRGALKSSDKKSGLEVIQHRHRYAVVYPSIHPKTGTPYQWYAPDRSTVIEIPSLADLTWLPDEWLEGLSVDAEDDDAAVATPTVMGIADVYTKRRADATLDGILEDLAVMTEGGSGRNDALNLAAYRIGRMSPLLDLDDARTRLFDVMRTNGYVKANSAFAARETIASGITAGAKRPYACESLSAQANLENRDLDDSRDDDGVDTLDDEFLTTFDLDALPDPEWLVRGWLEVDSINTIIGASGHLKSFVAIDLACHVALGLPWHGFEVKQVPVDYMVAEGSRGIRKRIRAWEQHYGRRAEGLRVLPRAIQSQGDEWPRFIESSRRNESGLIIVDTQARVTLGLEENSAKEMGMFIESLEALRRATGACVAAVHHKGKTGHLARGSSALYGAMTSEITVEKIDQLVTVSSTKEKDSADDLLLDLRPQIIVLGEDPEGKPITSLVLTPMSDLAKMLALDAELQRIKTVIVKAVLEWHPAGEGASQASVKALIPGHDARMFAKAWSQLVNDGRLIKDGAHYRWVRVDDLDD